MTIEDILPKPFTITIRGVDIECQPIRLRDALTIMKIGNIFQDQNATAAEYAQAEVDLNQVIGEVVPTLKDKTLDFQLAMEVIEQIMNHVQPSENKELRESGVQIDVDPKV